MMRVNRGVRYPDGPPQAAPDGKEAIYTLRAPRGERIRWVGTTGRPRARFGLEEEEAVALLERDYAPRCQPRLPLAELRGMVRRARRASTPPWGALLVRDDPR